jgi:hypothetical protein
MSKNTKQVLVILTMALAGACNTGTQTTESDKLTSVAEQGGFDDTEGTYENDEVAFVQQEIVGSICDIFTNAGCSGTEKCYWKNPAGGRAGGTCFATAGTVAHGGACSNDNDCAYGFELCWRGADGTLAGVCKAVCRAVADCTRLPAPPSGWRKACGGVGSYGSGVSPCYYTK